MLNPSTQIILAASRLALWFHLLAGLVVALLVLAVAGVWLVLPVVVILAWLIYQQYRSPLGQLKWEPHPQSIQWSWRERAGDKWCAVTLECDYLGPWLIGLKLDGRRLWVWPDSSDEASRRLLRRELVRLP